MIFLVQGGGLAIKGRTSLFQGELELEYQKKGVVLGEHFVTKCYKVANTLHFLHHLQLCRYLKKKKCLKGRNTVKIAVVSSKTATANNAG